MIDRPIHPVFSGKKIVVLISVLVFITTAGFADIIIVDCNGGGDYTTIQAGINAAAAGDTVKVKYGTYTESITINKNLTLTKYATFKPNITDTSGTRITLQSAEVLISGFEIETTAQHGNGIRVYGNQDVVIDDCIISGLYRGIFSEQIQIEIYDCILYDNHIGISITTETEESEYPAVIKGCSIYQNSSGIHIYSYGAPSVLIEECDIYENESEGLSLEGGYSTIKRCMIYDNIDNNYGYGIDCIWGYFDVINCTIYGNYKGVRCISNTYKIIVNSILWDNAYADIVGSPTVTYSCIEDGYTGTGNIDDNPQFEDAANDDYSLAWDSSHFSPCIDTGDPSMTWDDDDTPPDMGALAATTHRYDAWELPSTSTDNGWKWMCFPTLDDLTNNTGVYDGDMAQYMLEGILDPTILDSVIWKPSGSNVLCIKYDYPNWTNTSHIFTSPQGYKIKMASDEVTPLNISGFLEDPDTEFSLVGNGEDNWIGYFIDETQTVEDAFGDNMDNLYYIQTQDWSMARVKPSPGSSWIIPPGDRTLSYGDMVIVRCFDDDNNVSWDYSKIQIDPFERADAEYFTYTEQADYVPLFLELDPDDLPLEIGVYVDDECKGAEVVTNDTIDVRGYFLDGSTGDVSFQLYYGDKSDCKKVCNYSVYDPQNMSMDKTTINLKNPSEYYIVSFAKNSNTFIPDDYQIMSFPNPMRSNTTIRYSIPAAEHVDLSVYNCKGQYITTLVDEEQTSGFHSVTWNGKSKSGMILPNGMYFYKLSTQQKEIVKKIILMK